MGAEDSGGSRGGYRPNHASGSGPELTRRNFLKAGGGALAGIYALRLAGCASHRTGGDPTFCS